MALPALHAPAALAGATLTAASDAAKRSRITGNVGEGLWGFRGSFGVGQDATRSREPSSAKWGGALAVGLVAGVLRCRRRDPALSRHARRFRRRRAGGSKTELQTMTIAKPDSHKRTYSYIKLDNGLQAIIGSDSECDKAGAALCVNVGMCHERKDLPGLAHFLEHMLFTGTKTYPSEGAYQEFIQQNGGMANAYTACYFTNYMFDVKPDMLEPALDRFSRFFTEPLLTRDCTEREINAVDSEFQGGVTEPFWRAIGILNQSANPEHPFHVAVGNNKVLMDEPKERGIDLYEEMTKLYEETYSSEGMAICVFGRESNKELEDLIRAKFGSVLKKGVTMPVGDGVSDKPPFLPQDWNQLVLQNPVKDIKELTFSWVIPYQAPLWRSKPTRYISHLLGHEGAGSIIAVLKEQGLISSCYCGNGFWLEGAFSLLNVTFELTDLGLSHLDVIGQHLFAYIGMLQASPPNKRIFDEMAKLAEIQFKFGEDGQPFDMCPNIALGIVQGFPPPDALAGGSLLYEFDAAAISSVLERLSLDGVRVIHQSKTLAERCTDRDTSYDSPVAFEPIEAEWLRIWSEAIGGAERSADEAVNAAAAMGLRLPAPNPFIPEDVSVRPLPESGVPKVPTKLNIAGLPPVSCVYHRQDDEFRQPKAQVLFQIYTPFPGESIENWLHAELWCQAVEESLMEYAYDAAVAGVSYSLRLEAGEIILVLGGFNDKLLVLMDAVTTKMRSMTEIPETIFSIVADAYGDEIRNAAFRSPPYAQCSMRFNELTMKGFGPPAYKKYEAFQALKRQNLNGMAQKLFDKCHVEVLSLGNLLPQDVESLASALVRGLQLKESLPSLPEKAEAAIPAGSTVWTLDSTDEDSPNHAVFLRMQLRESLETNMLLSVLSNVLSSKFFDILRTQQQLGYIVAMQNARSANFCYLVAVVQTEFAPDYARSRIDDFLDEHFKFIEDQLGNEEFEMCRQGILSELKMKPKNLGEEMQRFQGQFSRRSYDFDRINRSIAFLESERCSLESLKAFTRERLKTAPRMYSQVKKVLEREDKPVPEGSVTRPDSDTLAKWTTHTETIEEFLKTAEWLPLNNKVDR